MWQYVANLDYDVFRQSFKSCRTTGYIIVSTFFVVRQVTSLFQHFLSHDMDVLLHDTCFVTS